MNLSTIRSEAPQGGALSGLDFTNEKKELAPHQIYRFGTGSRGGGGGAVGEGGGGGGTYRSTNRIP